MTAQDTPRGTFLPLAPQKPPAAGGAEGRGPRPPGPCGRPSSPPGSPHLPGGSLSLTPRPPPRGGPRLRPRPGPRAPGPARRPPPAATLRPPTPRRDHPAPLGGPAEPPDFSRQPASRAAPGHPARAATAATASRAASTRQAGAGRGRGSPLSWRRAAHPGLGGGGGAESPRAPPQRRLPAQAQARGRVPGRDGSAPQGRPAPPRPEGARAAARSAAGMGHTNRGGATMCKAASSPLPACLREPHPRKAE